MEKGLFPHRFNRPEKYRHRGRVPPLEEFVDEFSSAEQVQQAAAFVAEWGESEGWCFREQLARYLEADVALLRAGVTALTAEFLEFQLSLPRGAGSTEEEPAEAWGGKPPLFMPFNAPFFTVSR